MRPVEPGASSRTTPRPKVTAPRREANRPATPARTTGTSGTSSFTHASRPATPPSASSAALVGLSRGAVNYQGPIAQLHDTLLALDYFRPEIKANPGFGNTFGPKTEAAVKAFQRDHGLPASGRVDSATAAALVTAQATSTAPAAPAASASPPADPGAAASMVGLSRGVVNEHGSVAELHDQLSRLNYFPPEMKSDSGYGNTFGPKTEAAVRAFQRDQGLPPTGQVDAATASALITASPRPPPADPLAPPAAGTTPIGVATTVEQANQSFLSQWGGTAWNSAHGAPAGYEDCGPTSTAMVLSSLGLINHPSPDQAEATIGALRDQAVGHHTTQSQDTGNGQLIRALEANGAQATTVRPTLDNVDAALAAGHPLIVGSSSTWAAWGQEQSRAGDYLNHRNPGGHFVTVLGRAEDGNYIVGDPLSANGAREVTADQMKTLLGGSWNLIEVSR